MPVLRDVDLRVADGEHLFLTGPSGSGKSTLLRMIAGLDLPSSGVVTIAGKPATENGRILLRPRERDLALVFQDLGLWPGLSALGNVLLGLAGERGSRREKRRTALSVLDEFAMKGLESRKPSCLSAGQQQRVALARAFVAKPNVLLLDEPFAALDVILREEVFELVRRIREEIGCTVVTVSHQPSDAFGLAVDRVAILEDGKVVEEVSPEDLRAGRGTSATLQAWGRYRFG